MSKPEMSGLEERTRDIQAQAIIVENKMKEGLNGVDIRAIMYYMNLRARLDGIKGSLSTLLASTKTLAPAHRERLVLFLANTPPTSHDNKQRKVEIALSAFNISGGTNFTVNDLRTTLSSAEGWIKTHFAVILKNSRKAAKDASAVRKLEKKVADAEAELKELKGRQSRESAQRLEDETKLAVERIEKEVEEAAEKIRAKARDEVVKIRAKAKDEIAKLQSHRK